MRSNPPAGGRVVGGRGELNRESGTPKIDPNAWRGLNRQKSSSTDPQYGLAERLNREQGDGQSGSRGGPMPSSLGGSIGSLKPRDSSPRISGRSFDPSYRVPPPEKLPTNASAAPQGTVVKLTPDEVSAAIEMFCNSSLGYDRDRAIRTYATHKAEIQGKKR